MEGVRRWKLIERRGEVSAMLKLLVEERKELDEEIFREFGEEELKQGLNAGGGMKLGMRQRSSWEYNEETLEAIKKIKEEAIKSGKAEEINTKYLVIFQ